MRTLSVSTLWLALGALTLAGCKIEKPATRVPAPPEVQRFTASAKTVTRGATVTLSWKVANATSLEVRQTGGAVLDVPATTFEGSTEVTVSSDALFVLTARGEGGSDASAVAVSVTGSAGGLSFQAIPAEVMGGSASTLVWSAPGAEVVTLTGSDGSTLDLQGQLTVGAVTVTPRHDTTYTLTVDGEQLSTQVTVTPAVLSLDAPASVLPGGTVHLAWTTAGADRVVVSSAGRGTLQEITDAALVDQGSFDEALSPGLPEGSLVNYQLAFFRGTTELDRAVSVVVSSGPQIQSFTAAATAKAGVPYVVRWKVSGADHVELRIDGLSVFESSLAEGQFSFVVGTEAFVLELVAVGAGESRRSQAVDVVGVPTTATLTATPDSLSNGQTVTLSWDVPNARALRIENGRGEIVYSVHGRAAAQGSTSLTPAGSTTYTAIGDNLLNDPPVTATAAVTVTGPAPVTLRQFPPTVIAGQSATFSASDPDATLIGFGHTQVLPSTHADFIDISGTGQQVLAAGDDAKVVDVPFAVWLFGVRNGGSLTISRAGWMAFGATNSVRTSNLALPTSSAPANLIAPYWDDLQLTAASGVYLQLLGEAPDQTLVVQWNKLQAGSTAGTELTFQARIHQRGTVSFHYLTMQPNTSPTFTIGVQDSLFSVAASSTALPASDSALYLFSPIVGGVPVKTVQGAHIGGYVQSGGRTVLVTTVVDAYTVPGDLGLSELMFNPAPTVPQGQYLEVLNTTTRDLDMSGWFIRSGAQRFDIPPGFILPAGQVTVIGASTDPLENDDAGVALAWGSSLTLSPDGGSLTFGTGDGGATLTYAKFADAGPGVAEEITTSVVLTTFTDAGIATRNALVSRSGAGPLVCAATSPFGSQVPPQLGSPGRQRGCFGYSGVQVPEHFVDISATGTAVTFTSSQDDDTEHVTLAATGSDPAPFVFGARRPVISVCTNGWLNFNATESSTSYSNKTQPSSTTPLGVLAPFWDDLKANATNAVLYWKHVAASEDPVTPAEHWIVQWAHFTHLSAGDDLNFEVKLFTDGTVEYHYADMVSGSTSNYADGNSATVWFEEPTGTNALAVSINQANVVPHTAFRFSPIP